MSSRGYARGRARWKGGMRRRISCPLLVHSPVSVNPASSKVRSSKVRSSKVRSSKFKVQSSKFEVQSSKFKVQSSKPQYMISPVGPIRHSPIHPFNHLTFSRITHHASLPPNHSRQTASLAPSDRK